MAGQESFDSLSREELIRITLEQQKLIEQLCAEIEQLKRRGSAAPFSKGSSKANPRPPGRKPGHGPFLRREAPTVAPDQPVIPVVVRERCCLDCGGELGEEKQEIVSITDIPVQPRAEVRLYAVEVRRCRRCGRAVRGQQAEVAADPARGDSAPLGAAGEGAGARFALPARAPVVIEEMTGVRLTQSALTQDALKQAAGPLGAAYQRLRENIGKAEVVHTDDTGWRVGGRTAFLMVFATQTETVYQIRERHRNEEVREVISTEICGEFGQNLKQLLRQALRLIEERALLPPAEYQQQVGELDAQLTHHLRNRILRDDDNQRLLNGVGTQQDRRNLLRFLNDPRIEPTNNRAERALRPAVIARKVSPCSKNERGARAVEAFVSVLETVRKTCASKISDALCSLLAGLTPLFPLNVQSCRSIGTALAVFRSKHKLGPPR